MSNADTPTDWVDPDDAPELDDDWFDRADLMIGDRVIRRGRPPGSTKQAVSLRLDTELVTALRATGPGWQTRANEVLRKGMGL